MVFGWAHNSLNGQIAGRESAKKILAEVLGETEIWKAEFARGKADGNKVGLFMKPEELFLPDQVTLEEVRLKLAGFNFFSDEQAFQKLYLELGRYPGGSPKAVYDAFYNRSALRFFNGEDLLAAATAMVRELFLSYQEIIKRAEFKDPDKKVIVHFATGDTPWVAYRLFADLVQSWENEKTQVLLKKWGVDPACRVDPKRILAFPLDMVFPQKPTDYHSFYNILNNMFERMGIPKENRRLFKGNLIYDENVLTGGHLREMSDSEYSNLLQNIRENDLQVERFLDLKQPLSLKDPQYPFLKAMQKQLERFSGELQQLGGAHIFISGIGPSYEGKGHIGFMESGVSLEQKGFIGKAGHFIAAGHAKEAGGYKNTSKGHGFATFGFAELLLRQGQAPVKVIAIATGNNKSRAVLKGLEGAFQLDCKAPLEYPVRGLRSQNGMLIADRSSAGELRLNRYPWDFKLFSKDDWSDEMVKTFFIRVALEASLGCPKDPFQSLGTLKEQQFLDLPGAEHAFILRMREKNLKTLKAKKGGRSWETIRREVLGQVESNVVLPEIGEIVQKLGWQANNSKEIFVINPHLDDDYLAIFELLRVLINNGFRVSFFYTAKGSTAVDAGYVKNILNYIAGWERKEITETLKLSLDEVHRRLAGLLQKRKLSCSPLDYDIWNRMGPEEKKLRAQALFLDLNDKKMNGQLIDPLKIRAFVGLCQTSIDHHANWGHRDISFVADIKTFLRFSEGRSAIMSLGEKYVDIHEPWDSSWYTQEGRGGTAAERDVEMIKTVLGQRKPFLIIANGEGFPDFGAHSTTEASVKAAVLELLHSGDLDKSATRLLTYEGVWARKDTARAKLGLVLTSGQLDDLEKSFPVFYPTQAPAPVPDSGYDRPRFFSEAVRENAMISKEEYKALVPVSRPQLQKILAQKDSGILNYDLRDLSNPEVLQQMQREIREFKCVRKYVNRASNQELNGPAPVAEVFTFYNGDIKKLFYSLASWGCSEKTIADFFQDYVNEKDPWKICCSLQEIANLKNNPQARLAQEVYEKVKK
ncbi:MAG: hypothetical protein WC371_01945 [Parachlamydiales bacterium]